MSEVDGNLHRQSVVVLGMGVGALLMLDRSLPVLGTIRDILAELDRCNAS